MAHKPQKPHVSAALAHLQHGVNFAALVICLCTIAQMLAFGFVHYTQVRYQHNEPTVTHQSLSVVPGRAGDPAGDRLASLAPGAQPAEAAPTPKILSTWEPTLHVISDMAVTVGVIATVMLATFCLLGVAIAGGAAIPGVEKAVSAATWSLALALAAIPWRDVLVSMPFPGIFSSYDVMTSLSAAVDAGQGSAVRLFALYMLMPLAALAVSMLTLFRFRAGVAEGIIVTSVSELDERLEREMAQIRSRGITASAPRTVAALNEAIGDTPVAPAADPDPRRTQAAQRPATKSPRSPLRGLPVDEDDFKRPI